MSASNLVLYSTNTISSYEGVGFVNNPVASLDAYDNGPQDTNPSHFSASINWGDENGWQTGKIAINNTPGSRIPFLVKGSHTYDELGIHLIQVKVTGDGMTLTEQVSACSVANLPSPASQPASQPASLGGPKPLGNTELVAYSVDELTATQGQTLHATVAQADGYYDGPQDATPGDYKVQINWGDSPTWTTGQVVPVPVGSQIPFYLQGSHVYQNTGTYDVVVQYTGPDGQTLSDQTTMVEVKPSLLTLGDLSPTQWNVNETGYEGTIPVSGGTGGYQDLQVTKLPTGLTATVGSASGKVGGTTVQSGTITILGTPTQSGTFDLQVTLEDGDGNPGSGTYILTVDAAPMTLGSLSPTQWTQNEPDYEGTIAISGGSGTYSNAQVTGLPTGLSESLSGSTITIGGTPTQSGTFDLGVSVQDSNGTQASGSDTLTIAAAAAPALTLGSLSPTQWNVNEAGYDGTIPVSGGAGGYGNLQVSGLPTGLKATVVSSTATINGAPQSSGLITISGTPTQSGTFDLGVSVEDSNGTQASGSDTLTIVAPALTVGGLSPAQWDVNAPGYQGAIAISGGSGSYTNLSVTGLPAGLTAALSGSTVTVSGTPTQSGTFSDIAVSLHDGNGVKGSGTCTLTVNPAMSLGNLIGTDPLDPDDAAFNGAVDNSGDDNGSAKSQTLAASNATASNASVSNASVSLGGATPANAYVNELYQGTITINGGAAPYSNLSVTGLPAWMTASLSGSTITLTGTPPGTLPSSVTGTVQTLNLKVTACDSTKAKTPAMPYQLPVESAVQDLLDHDGGDNGSQLPSLESGGLVAMGPPTPLFNCYAYAANKSNPQATGWVWAGGPVTATNPGPPPGAVTNTPVNNNPKYPNGMLSFYASFGWYPVATGATQPSVPATGLVVLYETAAGQFTHAALVTTTADGDGNVFAKMGQLGTYEFSSVTQMAGGQFGQPALWLAQKKTPTVKVAPPASGYYTGKPFQATATITGSSGGQGTTLEGVGLTIQYFAGSTASGTPLSGPPVNVGTYTAVASFAGSADYGNAASTPATFTISRTLPTVKVSASGSTFTGKAFSATATVAGVNGQYGASLEGVAPTLTYYAGSSAGGTALPGAPVNAGTYTVAAAFAGSTDYTRAGSSATFTIAKATPTVKIVSSGNTSLGSGYWFTVYVVGVSGQYGSSLEGVSPTVAYYAGSSASGKALPGAPVNAGTYTVLVSFAGSADYTSASSSYTFTIKN